MKGLKEMETKLTILVCGDVAVDWIDSPIPPASQEGNCIPVQEHCRNWRLRPGTKRKALTGGTWLLGEIISKAVGDSATVFSPPHPPSLPGSDECVQSYMRLARYQTEEGAGGYWRVSETCGFDGPDNPQTGLEVLYSDDFFDKLGGKVDLLVVDDAANGFRASLNISGKLRRLVASGISRAVVYKMSRPLDPNRCPMTHDRCTLWLELQKACENHAVPLVVLIDANDLRAEDAPISRGLSWERASWETMKHLRDRWKSVRFASDKSIPSCWVVVRMGLEAALILTPGSLTAAERGHEPEPDNTLSATLIYDPTRAEDDYDQHVDGTMVGFSSTFAAAMAAGLLRASEEQRASVLSLKGILAEAAMRGLAAARLLLVHGFDGADAPQAYPADNVGGVISETAPPKGFHSIDVPSVEGPFGHNGECWSIASTMGLRGIEALARSIVMKGITEAEKIIPVAKYGKLIAITLSEIESYRSIQRLIREYRDAGVQNRPLCIGVFGKPGSGKSFGVKEVVRHILGDKAPSLTFNLSEFRDVSELSRAFHLIHDLTRDGTTPLVFFDEFDASLGSDKSGWVKYFLAPMQDGAFNDGADVHPIGRAIFVFAGGTKHTYQEFAAQASEPGFISAKGPDFLSRLRGFIDVMGTEPADHRDYFCLLRRAVMLRVSLEERTKTLGNNAYWLLDANKQIRIDTGVLRAFLKIPVYRNGVRSMTALLEVSELSSSRGFTRAALPSDALLRMHTGAEDFRKLVALAEQEDPLFLPAREELAQLVHEKYRKRNPGAKYDKPWSDLPEEIREDNGRQVDNYPAHLMAIGCTVELAGLVRRPYQLTPTDIDNMAKHEHERWCRDKRAMGWRHGTERNDLERIHPDLVSWEELPKDEDRKDLDAMRDIPEMLKRVGLCIVRI